MIPRLRFFLKQALSALMRSLSVTILAIVTIGVALAVLATFTVIVKNLARVAMELGAEVEVSAYLVRGIGLSEGQQLAAQIENFEEVKEARFLSSGASMAEFRESLGNDAVLLEGLPPDVLPPSIEVHLVSRPWKAGEVQALGAKLTKLEEVEDARYGQEDIERVTALLQFVRVVALVLGTALCLATILIVSNTIRLTVYARRDEIEIMSLVGATGSFVRAPFVMEGAIQGLFGGIVAGGTLVLMEEGLRVGIQRGLEYAYGPLQLQFVPVAYLGYLLAAGAFLGFIGSLLAVGKFLRG